MIAMIKIFLVCSGVLLAFFLGTDTVSASSGLQVRPYLLKEKLSPAEAKKGYIDVANPSDQSVIVTPSVRAFRQIDTQGNLEFYESKEVSAGIIPDLEAFTLGPREAVRMYYLVDGKRLPPGDIFAAILFSTSDNSSASGVVGATGVGTLLTLVNGTPGSRKAELDISRFPVLQFGQAMNGEFTLRNPADSATTSGFFPDVAIRLSPLSYEKKIEGPLLMAGNSRNVKVELPVHRLGIYKITVSVGDSSQSKWLLMATGWWRWVALPLLGALVVLAVIVLKKTRIYLRRKSGKKL